MIFMESRNVLVIGVIAICDWFPFDCLLSRVVCVADIMSNGAYRIMWFMIGLIAFGDQINGIHQAYSPSSSVGDLYQIDMVKQ